MSIGQERSDERKKHMEEVYGAIHYLGKPSVEEIRSYLEQKTEQKNKKIEEDAKSLKRASQDYIWRFLKKNLTKTISERTIERCIEKDTRISKDGRRYFIDDKIRYEKRYLNPKDYGNALYFNFVFLNESRNKNIRPRINLTESKFTDLMAYDVNQFITRWGIFLLFIFMEAAKPFNDKSMDKMDRGDLVYYWFRNAIPLDEMFLSFRRIFRDFDADSIVNRVGSEVNEELLNKSQAILMKNSPDLYHELQKIVLNGLEFGGSNVRSK
jgi:hypothetical protein